MKVLVLHNDYLSAGGERFSVAAEVAGLREFTDVEVSELTVTNEQFQNGGLAALRTITSTRESFAAVSDAIRKFKPDVVHAQNLFPRLGAGALEAISVAKLPYVRSLRNYRLRCLAGTCFRDGHDCNSCKAASHAWQGVRHGCYRGSRPASAGALLYGVKEAKAARAYPPDAFILLSDAMRVMLSDAIADTPVYIKPNPIAAPRLSGDSSDQVRTTDVLYLGRLSPEKRTDLVIDLAAAMPTRSFKIVGEGPDRESVSEAAGRLPNLTYVAGVTQSEAMLELGRARIVVVPSSWEEPFGRVAAEALAVGTPILVSDRGGLPDIAKQVGDSFVVRDDTLPSWQRHIDGILDMDPDRFLELSLRCAQAWENTFSPEKTSRLLAAIYKCILNDVSSEKGQRRA